MKLHQRFVVAAAAVAITSGILTSNASAQSLSDLRNIRIVVPFTAGGPTDAQARILAEEMGKILKVTVIVENKPGAGGVIGSGEVSRAKPDGSTLLYTPDVVVTQTPHIMKKMTFDPFTGLTPIARTSEAANVLLTNIQVPVKSVSELVAYAKQNPGKVNYASFGTGTVSHIYGEVLAKRNGVQMTHVPYKGSAESVQDFLSNNVQMMFQSPSFVAQFPGKIRVLATTGTKRNPLLPDVPTLAELGYQGFELGTWLGLYGPAGMSPTLVNELNAVVNKALQQPSIQSMWKTQAFAVINEPASGISSRLKSEHENWGKYFKELGIEAQ